MEHDLPRHTPHTYTHDASIITFRYYDYYLATGAYQVRTL